jgi:hypothetical protein
MSEAVPYIQLPPASRVRAVESVRQRLFELAEKLAEKLGEERPPADLALSTPAQTWLERLSFALADPSCTSASVAQMDAAMKQSLSKAEGEELGIRLAEFALVRDLIPYTATRPDNKTMLAVLQGLARRRAEAAA